MFDYLNNNPNLKKASPAQFRVITDIYRDGPNEGGENAATNLVSMFMFMYVIVIL